MVSCSRWGLVLAGLVLLASAGCGGPKLVPVNGKVTYKGEPITAAEIYFKPDPPGSSGTCLASSVLEEDGTFTMTTYPHGDGVAPGRYKVVLSLGRRTGKALDKYRRADKTPLGVEVPPEGLRDLVFELK
jgi:hypothetical protein